MTHCRNTHDTLQKYSRHIAEILTTHCRNTHDTLQKYSRHIAEILMTHCRNTHDTLQKYSRHIAEILMTHCRNTHDTLQKYSQHIAEILTTHEITNKYMYITQGIKIRLIEDLPYHLFCLRLLVAGYFFSLYFCIFCFVKFLLFPFSDFSRLFIC